MPQIVNIRNYFRFGIWFTVADLEGAHQVCASLFALICKTKHKFAPPVQSDVLYCSPRFNIFWIRARFRGGLITVALVQYYMRLILVQCIEGPAFGSDN